ncbi:beta-ketoacyl synthase N-terminal-like domain-containing protein [Pontivivens ytuae]|uniref:Ketosynthase family 3 (KS3) domain-containing protein n=1 Tax=Pontivivens ytuae TaxID=2789856 RepID=A0A7S9QEI5_9RHOB|nr:beta-ketoacyl synthase N-terminal-like domain-containing protein [Pontivivens ytuae]QPH56033.1 hypothetical protein I0K15_10050 [Pontivivens ytuae]
MSHVALFPRLYRAYMAAVVQDPSYLPASTVFLATNHGDADVAVRDMPETLPMMSRLHRGPDLEAVAVPTLIQSACSSGMTALISAAISARAQGMPSYVVSLDTLADVEILGFRAAKALAPERARPFSTQVDGLTIGEAGMVIKVAWHPASAYPSSKPDCTVIALLGFGVSCDAYHPTDPDPDGHDIERAWCHALTVAGLRSEDVDLVYLHGTGTRANDAVETKVCRRMWPESLPAVASMKSALGHTMGSAGVLNTLATGSALQEARVPPTLAKSERNLMLPVATGAAQDLVAPRVGLAVSSGFGGLNAALVLARLDRAS